MLRLAVAILMLIAAPAALAQAAESLGEVNYQQAMVDLLFDLAPFVGIACLVISGLSSVLGKSPFQIFPGLVMAMMMFNVEPITNQVAGTMEAKMVRSHPNQVPATARKSDEGIRHNGGVIAEALSTGFIAGAASGDEPVAPSPAPQSAKLDGCSGKRGMQYLPNAYGESVPVDCG